MRVLKIGETVQYIFKVVGRGYFISFYQPSSFPYLDEAFNFEENGMTVSFQGRQGIPFDSACMPCASNCIAHPSHVHGRGKRCRRASYKVEGTNGDAVNLLNYFNRRHLQQQADIQQHTRHVVNIGWNNTPTTW